MKKYLSSLLIVCMTVLTLTGCGKPALMPEESILALYNLYILEDSEGALALGMSESDVTSILTSFDKALTESLKNNITSAGLVMEDAEVAEIVAARKAALKKMNATCELVSSTEETAVVVLKTTYFDESALDQKAANDALLASQESDAASEEELLLAATKAYAKNLIDGYLSVTPSADYREITIDCTFKNNVWLPANMSSFGKDLGIAISGQVAE